MIDPSALIALVDLVDLVDVVDFVDLADSIHLVDAGDSDALSDSPPPFLPNLIDPAIPSKCGILISSLPTRK